jgi:hypothetical protein
MRGGVLMDGMFTVIGVGIVIILLVYWELVKLNDRFRDK